jgi:hypothetical protein
MVKEKHKEEMVVCPVGRFFMDLEDMGRGRSKFFDHLNRSRIEFLKAIRSVVEERIESIEKKSRKRGKKRATKIEVE